MVVPPLLSTSLKAKEDESEVQNSTMPNPSPLQPQRTSSLLRKRKAPGAENYNSRHARRGSLSQSSLPPPSRAGRRRLAGPVPAAARSGRAWGAACHRRQLMTCRYSTILPAMGRVLGQETRPPSLPRRPPTRYRVGWGGEPQSPGADDTPMPSPVGIRSE